MTDSTDDTDAREDRAAHVAALRAGAAALRSGDLVTDHKTLVLQVAAWIEAEAATLELSVTMVDTVNAVVKKQGGPESIVSFGLSPDRKGYAMKSDTSNHAVQILNSAERYPDE